MLKNPNKTQKHLLCSFPQFQKLRFWNEISVKYLNFVQNYGSTFPNTAKCVYWHTKHTLETICDNFWARKILVIFGLIRVPPVVPKKKISSDRAEKFRHTYSMCPCHAVKISTRSDHSLYPFALIKTDGQTDIQPASQPAGHTKPSSTGNVLTRQNLTKMRRKCSKTPTKPKNIYFVHFPSSKNFVFETRSQWNI